MKMCVLLLTCRDEQEAQKISKRLLEMRLVVCIKKLPVSSSYLWRGEIQSAREVMLVLESVEEKFKQIEKEIEKLHSYNTFTLVCLPISQTTERVKDWIKKELV